jgi:hypothetical protein
VAAVAVARRACSQDGCEHGTVVDASWQAAFEATWPTVERRLRTVLRSRKVPPGEWEDYLQEVATRAIASHVEFHCAADLLPWASTVLRRLHGDDLHRAERLEDAQRLLVSRRTPDVAAAVMAKLDLDRVAEAVAAWPDFDRVALVADGDESKARGTSASYVRRHRLRAKLLTIIDGLGGVVAGARRFRVVHAQQADQLAAMVLSPVALACAALVLPYGPGAGGAGGGRPPSPPGVVAMPAARSASIDATAATSSAAPGARTTSAASHGGNGHGDGGGGGGDGHRPGDHDVQVIDADAADQHVAFGVEDEDEDAPLYCGHHVPVVGDQCVDYPVPVDDVDVPLPSP